MKHLYIACAWSLALVSSVAHAEDIQEVFKKVGEYVQQKNYPKAMEELQWAQRELEKLNQERLGEILPANVEGYAGGETQVQSVMGFSSVERVYTKGEQSITLSIAGSSAGGDAMGGLAGIAKMGMMMGGSQPGREQFRIDGLTASLDSSSGAPELTVFLEGGSMLQLKASDEAIKGADLKKFAQGLKLGSLDAYLRGSKG